MSTQTNTIVTNSLKNINERLRALHVLEGGFECWLVGKFTADDTGSQIWDFQGAVPVQSVNSKLGTVDVYLAQDGQFTWTVKPQTPYTIEIAHKGDKPTNAIEVVIDADTLWPTEMAGLRASMPVKTGKATQPSRNSQIKTSTTAAVKPTIKDAQAKLEAALAAFTAAETGTETWTAAAKAVGEAQAEVTRLRNERQLEQQQREADKAKAEADAKAKAEADAHKAEFNRRYELIKVSRQEVLNVAQAALDLLLQADDLDAVAIKAARTERDSAKALLDHERLVAMVEESFATELANQQAVSESETPAVIEQPNEQAPKQPNETPELELPAPVIESVEAAVVAGEALASEPETTIESLVEQPQEQQLVAETPKTERKGRNRREKVAA